MDDKDKKTDATVLIARIIKGIAIIVFVGLTLYLWPINQDTTSPPPATGDQTEQVSTKKDGSDYQLFIRDVMAYKISKVYIKNDGTISVVPVNGQKYNIYFPSSVGDPNLVKNLSEHNVSIMTEPPVKPSGWTSLLLSFGPMLLLIVVWIYFMRRQGGAAGQAGKFAESKAKCVEADEIKERFVDVAGVDSAVADVAEVVDFLHNPAPYTALGAKIPRGVILTGAPGCGKTLLARAIAGEAKVPFFSVSGSEFVEMFVGVGASRVRDTFEQAQKRAPSIIFIDEIDAIGRSRSSGHGNNNDEREQTLNEILTRMDGFGHNDIPVIVLAATNRDDILDAALMRAGRFDRKVQIQLPDLKGREQILRVHTFGAKPVRPLEDGIDLLEIVRGLTGQSGADIANLANEAALTAVRRKATKISANDFELSKDKVMMGSKSGRKMNSKDKRNTAYHEAGHAIIGSLEPEFDPCTKVTVVPRDRALGVTQFIPPEDELSLDKAKIFSTIRMAYGGRAAEEIINGADKITTGASNDIQRITSMLTSMIMQWGMSGRVGQLAYASEYGDHLAQGVQKLPYSERTAQIMDDEKIELSEKLYKETMGILLANRDKMDMMAEALLEWETIETEQIQAIMKGQKPLPPKWYIAPTKTSPEVVSLSKGK